MAQTHKRILTAQDVAPENEAEILEKLNRIGTDILRAARDELYIHMHFLDVALSAFLYEMSGSIDLIGTDGLHMFFDPRKLGGLFQENRILVNRAYLHIVYHCLFLHMFTEAPDQRLWDISCDIAVEYMIDKGDYRSTRWSRSLFRRETYRELEASGKTLHAQRIYRLLSEKELSEENFVRLEQEFRVCDHSQWDNHHRERPKNRELENRWKEADEKIETQMTTFGQQAAVGAGELLDQIKVKNRGKTDYRAFLMKFASFREETEVDPDTFDYHFYSYGLTLYKNMPLIEPQETKEVKRISDFVIVIDTSMSTAREQVFRFLEKTYEILAQEESFFSRVNVHIIQCDEKVQEDVIIHNQRELTDYMDHFTLYGGGGTDFRPAFSYVMEKLDKKEITKLKGLLYFTDGYGIYPQQRPPYDTAFVFLPENGDDASVPPWAMKVVLDEEELNWT